MANFLKKAFRDMKEGAMAQHKVDKANWDATKAENKANWEEAKANANPENMKKKLQAERDAQVAAANERKAAADARAGAAKSKQ